MKFELKYENPQNIFSWEEYKNMFVRKMWSELGNALLLGGGVYIITQFCALVQPGGKGISEFYVSAFPVFLGILFFSIQLYSKVDIYFSKAPLEKQIELWRVAVADQQLFLDRFDIFVGEIKKMHMCDDLCKQHMQIQSDLKASIEKQIDDINFFEKLVFSRKLVWRPFVILTSSKNRTPHFAMG